MRFFISLKRSYTQIIVLNLLKSPSKIIHIIFNFSASDCSKSILLVLSSLSSGLDDLSETMQVKLNDYANLSTVPVMRDITVSKTLTSLTAPGMAFLVNTAWAIVPIYCDMNLNMLSISPVLSNSSNPKPFSTVIPKTMKKSGFLTVVVLLVVIHSTLPHML